MGPGLRRDDNLGEAGASLSKTSATRRYGQISTAAKKKAISCAAVYGESEPCTELASIDSAKSLRIVPGAALAGSVAPITSRFRATASSPSSTCTTTGPELMKSTRLR